MQLPGRTINADSSIMINRTLPANGEVLAQRGQQVEALDVVARVELPHRYRIIDVARQLAQPEVDMSRVMLKAVGDWVKAKEVMAVAGGGLPFLQRSARAPAAGYIAAVGPGWVLLETERTIIEIQAFINGVVTKIIPYRGVVIEAHGAMIQAACGFGGEAYGRLHRLAASPFESLPAGALNQGVEQTILVGGRSVDETLLRRAEAMQVRGIIVGSINAALLNLDPPVKVRVVATEGFGHAPMSAYTFALLTALNGRHVSMRGQTPGLASSVQGQPAAPPVILATTSGLALPNATGAQPAREIKVGSRVRITRGSLLGVTGHIASMPAEPQPVPGGVVAPGAYVTIDKQEHFVPWANLEQVQ
ncbi:MAG: hypothetical protein JW953_10165 [Anaerolineae bacterium]|nr:hypothetical protein [Anaerolineae bacterium]